VAVVKRIIRWFRRHRWTTAAFSHTVTVRDRGELPVVLSARAVYLVGTDDAPKWVLFDCPCGRGHEVQLRLSGECPLWRVTTNAGRARIRPSVDIVDSGARCHFWLCDGRTVWVHRACEPTTLV
jgi:hypothetical protein